MRIDLEALGMDEGADVLVMRAMRRLDPGEALEIEGRHPELALHLRGWARARGHTFQPGENGVTASIVPAKWFGRMPFERAGRAGLGGVVRHALPEWGLAARGANVEAGGPSFDFGLLEKVEVWSDDAARLYARAAAAQWDPATAIDWDQPIDHDEEIEDAVVQVMTYLVENETAALVVPARFAARVHAN